MWYRRDFSRETMRDFSLARSLVSQGWSREKSRSRENPIDTLRDPTLHFLGTNWVPAMRSYLNSYLHSYLENLVTERCVVVVVVVAWWWLGIAKNAAYFTPMIATIVDAITGVIVHTAAIIITFFGTDCTIVCGGRSRRR